MFLLLILLLGFFSSSLSQSVDADLYSIQHSIDKGEFREIGYLNLRSIRQSQNQAQFQSYNSENDDQRVTSNLISTPMKSDIIDETTRLDIKTALETNQNSVYRLRLCRKSSTQETDCYAGSFIYLEQLIMAEFQINLILNTGATNRLTSISIRTKELTFAGKKSTKISLSDLEYLTMYIQVQGIRQGQTPETEAYLEKLKKEIESKEKTAQGGNESFLQKYWIYIVPGVIIMFLMNLLGQDGPAQ